MLTKTGNTFYAAPEIYHNSSYSKEVDMWSVGVVMYQCLTGRLPLHRDNIGDFVSLLGKSEEWNFLS
jgi:serine/threonine protein kinase